MLKKLLALFGIGKEEEEQPVTNHCSRPEPGSKPEDDDDDDPDSDGDDDPVYAGIDPDENPRATNLDPVTLHGTHYTIEEFDAEIDRRVQKQVREEKADGEEPDEYDLKDYKLNHRREVYVQWNKANTEQMVAWENLNSFEQTGVHAFGATPHDENNPLLQPIHGITLQDYAAAAAKLEAGVTTGQVITTLGVDKAAWEEANVLWFKRMQEDTTYAVANLYGQYFKEAGQHPKLGDSLQAAETPAQGKVSIERMMTDREFYTDVQAEMNAAYEYGIDGAQQAFEKYGVNIGDMGKIAMHYAEKDGNNMEQMDKWARLLDKKMKEYAGKYATQQGGNIADDIEF